MKNWFQHKEVMAGNKRLFLSYFLYKIFGSPMLRLIAFFVGSGAFLTAKERRKASYSYFKILSDYVKISYPLLLSTYKQFLNYANALCDKIISFSNGFSDKNFRFKEGEDEIFELIKNGKGVFFLTTHIGNIEILRSFLNSDTRPKPDSINIFLEKRTCEVFNRFLDFINGGDEKIYTYPVEETSPDIAVKVAERADNGGIIFMAGDRISHNSPDKTYDSKLLGRTVKLPSGVLRFAQIINVPIFFITCIKEKGVYKIYAKKFDSSSGNKKEIFERLKKEYGTFLEKCTVSYPFQFYHFYDMFGKD